MKKTQRDFINKDQENQPANPRAEDFSFFVLEALSNVSDHKPRKLSQVAVRPEDTSGLIPKGSKTESSELKSHSNQQNR